MTEPASPRRRARLLLIPLILAACGESPSGPTPTDDGPTPVDGSKSRVVASQLQATPSGYIRIGVVPSATSIEMGAVGEYTVRNKATGELLATGSGEPIQFRLGSAAVSRTRDWLQIVCTGLASRRDNLMAAAVAAGFEADSEDAGGCWRVFYGSLPAGSDDVLRDPFQAQLAAAGLFSAGLWKTRTTVEGVSQIEFTAAGASHVVAAPVVVEAGSGVVTIDGDPYRGLAEVWTNSGGSLAGINELPLEEYLYGVVPKELPPEPYGLPEAQKAQAITARTYALANMGKRAADGYDLLDTTGDQVYGGYEVEHPVSTAAVDATRGLVAVHEGDLISTLYHSTSGGYTANSEDVYRDTVSYLRGVPDAERGKALEHVPTLDVFLRHPNPTNLRAHAEGDFESDWSRYHRWEVDWSRQDMAEVLAESLGEPITSVDTVRVTDRADHGRVQEIEFVTDAGTFSANKDAIRWTLKYIDLEGEHVPLRSTLFFIQPVVDRRTGEVTGWKAYGGGWGHGVGMSQTGAVGMAKRGRSYEEILKHYYRGIEIEQR